jgi:hypothetical protein
LAYLSERLDEIDKRLIRRMNLEARAEARAVNQKRSNNSPLTQTWFFNDLEQSPIHKQLPHPHASIGWQRRRQQQHLGLLLWLFFSCFCISHMVDIRKHSPQEFL